MRSSRSRSIVTGTAAFEQLERRQMLASAITPVVGNTPLPGDASYVQPGKFIYKSGGSLSQPAAGKPLDIALSYVKNNAKALGLSQADVTSSVVTDSYTDADSGITHVYLRQTYNGLEIYNTDMTITVMKDGSVLSVGGSFVPGVGTKAPAPEHRRSTVGGSTPVHGALSRFADSGRSHLSVPAHLSRSVRTRHVLPHEPGHSRPG